jgi:hypothetical protein
MIRLQPEDVAEIRDNYFRLRLHRAAGQQQNADIGAGEIHFSLLSIVKEWIRRNRKPPFVFADDQTLGAHRLDDKCYCNRCVELRNKPLKITADFRDSMLRCGFTDADSAGVREQLRESVGAQLYDDVVYLLQRIHSLPDTTVSSRRWFRPDHLGVAQPAPDRFLFDRAIANLRADKRSVTLPKSHGTSIGRGNYQNTVVSNRIRAPWPSSSWRPSRTPNPSALAVWATGDFKRPTPFWTLPEKFHGNCVDLCPTATLPMWTKPMHDFYYGDLSKFESVLFEGEPKFAPSPLVTRLDDGEREYLVGEPTPEQIKHWKKLHTTKSGRFKRTQYKNEFDRLQQMVSKEKFFGGLTDESKGYTGIMLGKPYQGQSQVPLYHNQLHATAATSLDAIFPTMIESAKQIVWTSSIRPPQEDAYAYPCARPRYTYWVIPEEKVTNVRWLKGIVGKSEQKLKLYEFSWEPTKQELRDAEGALRAAADYDPKLHAELEHLYQYKFKYIRPDRSMSEIFTETRKTQTQPKRKDTKDIYTEIRNQWDTTIQVTFGHVQDTPPSGFYVMHKMSEQATTRVYLVIPTPPLKPDAWDEEDGPLYLNKDTGELGDPPLVERSDIQANIRSTAATVRSKHVNEMTVRRNLGKLAFGGQMAHIRFYRVNGRLAWG